MSDIATNSDMRSEEDMQTMILRRYRDLESLINSRYSISIEKETAEDIIYEHINVSRDFSHVLVMREVEVL